MPELLHLPPVAQAVLTITGVVLAVAIALVLAVGAWFTASRGDQRPVEAPKAKAPTLPLLVLFVPAALVSTWPYLTGCANRDRSADIKTAIDGARAACLVYTATRSQLPKPVPEADELCPLLQARDAVSGPSAEPAAVAEGGAGG